MTVALAPTPVLETDRLTLRAPAARDWEAWRDFIMSDRGYFMRPADTITEEQAWRAWSGVIGHWVMRGWGSFVYCLRGTDEALGLCGPWAPISWPEREIGWSVWSAENEGRGYVAEAARAAIAHAYHTLGWETAVSYIDPGNTRSVALARRLGATHDPQAPFPGTPPIMVWRHPRPAIAGGSDV